MDREPVAVLAVLHREAVASELGLDHLRSHELAEVLPERVLGGLGPELEKEPTARRREGGAGQPPQVCRPSSSSACTRNRA